MLFIGDSITDGAWGNSKVWNTPSAQRNHNDMNHIYGHGYMMIAASHYEALYPEKGWTFWNRGISGNTLDDLAARWQDDVLALKPDIVSILIGTNDVDKALREGRGIDTVEWAARLGGLLDKVREENPQARFVLCTPFVAKAGKIGEREDYDKRKRMIQEICVCDKGDRREIPRHDGSVRRACREDCQFHSRAPHKLLDMGWHPPHSSHALQDGKDVDRVCRQGIITVGGYRLCI